MSSRARKRARAAAAGEVSAAKAPEPGAPKPPSRSELRNAAVRAQLEPLREGERPQAVTVAALVAGALVVANVALAVGGYEIQGKKPAVAGVVVFTGLLVAMTIGLWRARYWAVLGMEALLAITMMLFALALPFASNVRAVVVSLVILIPSGALFWFLIRAMARIQMPARR
jgi:hypothetical protein